jgi:sugar phosphate isomerase/epimerase
VEGSVQPATAGPIQPGICGELVPEDPAAIDDRVAGTIAGLGFVGVTAHFGAGSGIGPDDLRRRALEAAREALEARGVRVVQSWAFGVSFVHADPEAQSRDLDRLAGALRVAGELGAEGVITGCGSLSPAGRYAPHPANRAPGTCRRLVEALKPAAELVERAGIDLVLEPHVLTALHSPEVVREVVDAVGSPRLRVNLDLANLVGSLDALWSSAALVERVFDTLGEVAVSGHLKDVRVDDRFVLHLDEAVPGEGELDLVSFVRRFAERLPGRFLFLEHLPASAVPRARDAFDVILGEALA